MSPAAPERDEQAAERDEQAAAIGRLGAALLIGRSVDVPGIDRQTEARVRTVIERLLAARAAPPIEEDDE